MHEHKKGKLLFVNIESSLNETMCEILQERKIKLPARVKKGKMPLREFFEDELMESYMFRNDALYKIQIDIDYNEIEEVRDASFLTCGNIAFEVRFDDRTEHFEGAVLEAVKESLT